jgi:hypothetical protein
MTLDKTQVARRQLGTALALFIEDLDPVSVHALACAGGEVAEYLAVKSGGHPFSGHALATFRSTTLREIRRIRNQFWNSFKHATTRDAQPRIDEDLLERFTDVQNDHALFVGWYDYVLATKTMPIEAQAFQAWYFALYPDKLNPEVDATRYANLFPGIRELSRVDQKEALRQAIAAARQDAAIMADPNTERAHLICRD